MMMVLMLELLGIGIHRHLAKIVVLFSRHGSVRNRRGNRRRRRVCIGWFRRYWGR